MALHGIIRACRVPIDEIRHDEHHSHHEGRSLLPQANRCVESMTTNAETEERTVRVDTTM